jgi:Putative prokaryotic signal transducing protein
LIPASISNPNKLVSVGRFADPFELQMARGMLESAGIECFLEGSNMNALVPSAFRARLQVRESDEGNACDLLAELLPGTASAS